MKSLLTVFTGLLALSLYSQVPQKISFQTVVRDNSNNLVKNSPVGIRVSIRQGSAAGTVAYQETHSVSTNLNGLATFEIGSGIPVISVFSSIDWGNAPCFLEVEADPNGGTSYSISGTSELLSVPYALYAEQAPETPGSNAGDIKYWDGTNWVLLAPGLPGQFLQLDSAGLPRWQGTAFTPPTSPTVSTAAVTAITSTAAVGGGTVLSNGLSPILEGGVCYSTTPNPTVSNMKAIATGSLGAFTVAIPGLNARTTYYVRAYATNAVGTSYGSEVNFTTSQGPAFSIGMAYGGGIIFYLDASGNHGLIAMPANITVGSMNEFEWGCSGTAIAGADLSNIGSGLQNTIDIEAGCAAANTAADVCANLVYAGYSDWYLPSKDELYQLYIHRNAVGGFGGGYYWSSSEYNAFDAYYVNFGNGNSGTWVKSQPENVRAIRSF
ncbi:MAG TPA: hypothetical protein DIU20_08240 [Cryomorphaceae bacterium]|nr:hypothetical protein [Cryomorphaceae bacterium]